jgi:hypothetical protein
MFGPVTGGKQNEKRKKEKRGEAEVHYNTKICGKEFVKLIPFVFLSTKSLKCFLFLVLCLSL